MKTSAFVVNLLFYGPYFILLVLFIIFFYRAARFHGITKLKKFTVVMLGVFVVAFALRYFQFSFFDWVPIQFLKVAGNANTINLLIFLTMIFFVVSITKIRTEKNARMLTLNWLLIGLFSIAYIGWLAYLYMNWKEPVINENASPVQKIIMTHIMSRSGYTKQIIYPTCWVLVACISLWKIKKERRRMLS
jgi:hypothetical protein